MKASDTIGQLTEALAAFQSTITNPARNRTVNVPGKYSFDYATFDAILALVRPALASQGLAFVQGLDNVDGKPFVVTRLSHKSGEWIEASTPVVAAQGNGPQAFGSSITYAKRYALTAMLGISADEDDDGAAAADHKAEKTDRPAKPANAPHPNAPTDEPGRALTPAEKAMQWAQTSLAKVRAMKTIAEVDDWEGKNWELIDKLQDNHRETWTLLKKRLTEARQKLSQKEAA